MTTQNEYIEDLTPKTIPNKGYMCHFPPPIEYDMIYGKDKTLDE